MPGVRAAAGVEVIGRKMEVAKLSARTIKPLVEFGREFISSRLIWSRQPAKRLTM